MTEPILTKARERLRADPASVLAVLPAMGKLMITASHLGATHERIGVVQSVAVDNGWIVNGGAEHESRVDGSAVAEMIVDRTGGMGDKIFPRIDFLARDGGTLFSVVGFEGLEPFDAALAPLGAGEPVEPKPDEPRGERAEVEAGDPGGEPFEAALASGTDVVVAFRRPGFEQVWRGKVEAIKPAMGFINIMRPDFHLHLKAGAVARWRGQGTELAAENGDGADLGLVVIGAN